MKMLKRKPVQMLLVLALAAAALAAGAFAWTNFTQSQINLFSELILPDVNLHDDFVEGPNKDVYVENSGKTTIYVRVQLTEYMEAEGIGTLIDGHTRDESKAYLWSPHNGLSMADETVQNPAECNIGAAGEVLGGDWRNGDTFHKYYSFIMGGAKDGNENGQIYYKPATAEQKGEYDENNVLVRPPVVVVDPLTGTSPQLDAGLDYREQIAALTADGTKTEADAMAELGLKKTLTSNVITMDRWVKGDVAAGREPWATGDFWVVDTDGWCYWANPLEGGTATGLLLDKVVSTGVSLDAGVEYCINVDLQAVDDDDIGLLANTDRENGGGGGITENGNKLVHIVAGTLAVAADGTSYEYDKTAMTYTELDDAGMATGQPFVTLGGTQPDVNAAKDNRLAVGARIAFTDPGWNGVNYTNFDTYTTAPWYNLALSTVTDSVTDGGKPIYEVLGTTVGVNGRLYLKIAPVIQSGSTYVADTANPVYLGSLADNVNFTATYPGSGPFALVWAGTDGSLGTNDDAHDCPTLTLTVDGNIYEHQGNGVYLKTGESPAVYYFAGKNVSQSEAAVGSVVTIFPLQLKVGDKFDVSFTEVGGQQTAGGYTKSDTGAYTFSGLTMGADKRQYLYLGSTGLGYLAVGDDLFLGNAGDVRRWANSLGQIGTNQDRTVPYDFTEDFLLNKTKADMEPSGTFTVDGVEWGVLAVDAAGNRLLMVTGYAGKTKFNATVSDVYAGSILETAITTYYENSMSTLKAYVQPVSLTQDGVSQVSSDTAAVATAFALSKAEIEKYMPNQDSKFRTIGLTWWTRTVGVPYSGRARVYTIGQSGSLFAQADPTADKDDGDRVYRPAVWVKFSDVK